MLICLFMPVSVPCLRLCLSLPVSVPALPLAAPTYVALVRRDFLTRTVPLSEAHHALLTAIQGGQAVAAALAHVCARYGFDPLEAERGWHSADGVRARWIDWGFFVAADSL